MGAKQWLSGVKRLEQRKKCDAEKKVRDLEERQRDIGNEIAKLEAFLAGPDGRVALKLLKQSGEWVIICSASDIPFPQSYKRSPWSAKWGLSSGGWFRSNAVYFRDTGGNWYSPGDDNHVAVEAKQIVEAAAKYSKIEVGKILAFFVESLDCIARKA
ncbi:MAG: hypothetical protein WBO92_00795 [Candidatus Moraniibacteriota bacterium]